jgi:hypothetical protein
MGLPWLEGGQSGHGAGNALSRGLSKQPCLVNDVRAAVQAHELREALTTATAGLAATTALNSASMP